MSKSPESVRTPDSGKCLSKTFQNIREYDVFRQFRQFRDFLESGELFWSGPVLGVRRSRLSGTPFSGAGLRVLSLSGPLSGVRRPHFPLPQLEKPQLPKTYFLFSRIILFLKATAPCKLHFTRRPTPSPSRCLCPLTTYLLPLTLGTTQRFCKIFALFGTLFTTTFKIFAHRRMHRRPRSLDLKVGGLVTCKVPSTRKLRARCVSQNERSGTDGDPPMGATSHPH